MHPETLRNLLEQLAGGQTSVEEALARLQTLPFEATEHATIDHHRALRCGFPEVVFAERKSTQQVVEIFERISAAGHNALATRVAPETSAALAERFPDCHVNQVARTVSRRSQPRPERSGTIAVVAAGTSDLPVAEEARETAEILDTPVDLLMDVGVAGLHRLLPHVERLRAASALVVVAGMEGALPSVIGGLVERPVIAVPTSVGYGANLGGVTTMLAMLTSCASGVSVVNIDNGFGAAYQAALIHRLAHPLPEDERA